MSKRPTRSGEAVHRAIVAAPILLCLTAITGCSNPLPFGPGRVEVALDKAAVHRVTRGTLLPDSDPEWRDRPTNVIRFDVSSKADLIRYFEDWDRMVQTRCFVRGAEDGRSYRGFAVGPMHRAPDIAGKFRYTVYAFLDLMADDEEYADGRPRGTFDLSTGKFSSVGCFMIGVTKAPLIFPRTNTFYLSEQKVKDGILDLDGAAQQAAFSPEA